MELHDEQTEMAVLGAFLREDKYIDQACVDLFHKKQHQTIFRAIWNLHSNGSAPDIVTVSDELRRCGQLAGVGGRSYIVDLLDSVGTATRVRAYLDILERYYHKRQLRLLAEHIQKSDDDPAVVVARIEAALSQLQPDESDDYASVAHLAEQITSQFCEDKPPDQGTFFETRIQSLNEQIGGIFKKELTIVAAEPSQGKTAFATDFCVYAGKRGHKSLIITLDEENTAVVVKMVSSLTGIPARQLQTVSPPGTPEQKTAARTAAAVLKDRGVFIAEKPGMDIFELRSLIRRVSQKEGLDIVVIDYIQNLRPRVEDQTLYDKISEASRICKAIAAESEVAMVVISQLKRESNRVSASFDVNKLRQPTTDRLLGSGMLTADANLVLFPWRPVAYIDQYVRNDDPTKPDMMNRFQDANGEKATIIIGKQKMGAIGDIDVYFNPKQMRFTERHDWVPF